MVFKNELCPIHFYGRVRGECDGRLQNWPGIVNERPKFLAMRTVRRGPVQTMCMGPQSDCKCIHLSFHHTYRTVYWARLNGHFLEVLLVGHHNCLNGLKRHTETLVKVTYMYL